MNRLGWILAAVLSVALAMEFAVPAARSSEPESVPFVGFVRDGEGHWAALRANGEVYVSEGTGWLDPVEYRYTIRPLEEAFAPKKKK
ncbi:MAG: hypothetical protein ABIH26_14490 [Candidatus Eisenbacteria bacterium]